MDRFLTLISENMNVIINIAGLAVLFLLIYNLSRINNHKDRIKDALGRKNTKSTINKKTHEIMDEDIEETVTPDTIRGYETDFNKSVALFNSISQLIPIFPLFGILGTIAGLILQLQAKKLSGYTDLFNSFNLYWNPFIEPFPLSIISDSTLVQSGVI